MTSDGNTLRTAHLKRQRYEKGIRPAIGSRSIFDIDHDDLHKILSDKAKLHPIGSNQDQKLLSRLFSWAVTEGRSITGLKTNPAQHLKKLGKDVKRDRYLDEREIGYVLRALGAFTSDLAGALRLLLLTGCRRDEVVSMTWDELDLDKGEWLIPGSRTKNKMEHLVPLPPQAVKMLKGIKRHEESPLVFYSRANPKNSFSGFSRAFANFEKEVATVAAEDKRTVPHFTIHDLRRTVASGMSGLRDADHRSLIQPAVVESVLNHISGSRAGVAGVYNRHTYFVEKREALRLWANHLDMIEAKPLALAA
jgi:integrase